MDKDITTYRIRTKVGETDSLSIPVSLMKQFEASIAFFIAVLIFNLLNSSFVPSRFVIYIFYIVDEL